MTEAARGSGFEVFTRTDGERLRRVLVARHGVDIGNDVHADAIAYAWEHWDQLHEMENPVGYLYRVAQSASRRHRRWRRPVEFRAESPVSQQAHDRDLELALGSLKPNQRVCVVLVHVYDWTYQQTADAIGMSVSSVRNHVHRGLAALRSNLEEM